MTLQQFVNKWLGQEADFDGFYGGQCVDLFRFYCRDVLKISQPKGVVGAKDFWTNYDSDLNLKNNFTKILNTSSFIPIAGDVAVWNGNTGNGFGHIGIVVDDKHTTDYFYSFDQNWSKISFCEIVKHNYNNFYGVLRPKSIPEGDNMSDYEEAIRKAVAYDEVCKLLKQPTTTSKEETVKKLSEIISDKERYLRERNEARVERDNYAKEIKGLNVQIELLKKEKQEQSVQIKSLQEDITELNNELENCNTQIPGEEDLEQNSELNGWGSTELFYNEKNQVIKKINKNYKVKE